MTLLVSWIGVDDKKEGKSIASLYIASDSRYSWGTKDKYDYGIKVFGSINHPDIFGFCGEVVFPSIVLGQFIPQIDAGLIFDDTDNGITKNKKFFNYVKSSIENYPKKQLVGTFIILHGTRKGKDFKCFKTVYKPQNRLESNEIDLPLISTKIFSGGSGKNEFDSNFMNWKKESHNNYGTSRGVFHCLVDTLNNIQDNSTGGKPQIIGLYRNNNSRIFRIIDSTKKYVYGKNCSENIISTRIEWRNENFERVNPESLKLLEGAQRQPK